jgi:hypothetical protein
MYARSWSFAILACCACTIFRTLSLSALEAMRDGETSSIHRIRSGSTCPSDWYYRCPNSNEITW